MASALNVARATIEETLRAAFVAAGYTDVAMSWRNVAFEPPVADRWFKITVLWGEGTRQTMGRVGTGLGWNEVAGVVQVDQYSRPGSGSGGEHADADVVRNAMNRMSVAGVRFGVPGGPRPIPSDHPAWERATVSCAFVVEESV